MQAMRTLKARLTSNEADPSTASSATGFNRLPDEQADAGGPLTLPRGDTRSTARQEAAALDAKYLQLMREHERMDLTLEREAPQLAPRTPAEADDTPELAQASPRNLLGKALHAARESLSASKARTQERQSTGFTRLGDGPLVARRVAASEIRGDELMARPASDDMASGSVTIHALPAGPLYPTLNPHKEELPASPAARTGFSSVEPPLAHPAPGPQTLAQAVTDQRLRSAFPVLKEFKVNAQTGEVELAGHLRRSPGEAATLIGRILAIHSPVVDRLALLLVTDGSGPLLRQCLNTTASGRGNAFVDWDEFGSLSQCVQLIAGSDLPLIERAALLRSIRADAFCDRPEHAMATLAKAAGVLTLLSNQPGSGPERLQLLGALFGRVFTSAPDADNFLRGCQHLAPPGLRATALTFLTSLTKAHAKLDGRQAAFSVHLRAPVAGSGVPTVLHDAVTSPGGGAPPLTFHKAVVQTRWVEGSSATATASDIRTGARILLLCLVPQDASISPACEGVLGNRLADLHAASHDLDPPPAGMRYIALQPSELFPVP